MMNKIVIKAIWSKNIYYYRFINQIVASESTPLPILDGSEYTTDKFIYIYLKLNDKNNNVKEGLEK